MAKTSNPACAGPGPVGRSFAQVRMVVPVPRRPGGSVARPLVGGQGFTLLDADVAERLGDRPLYAVVGGRYVAFHSRSARQLRYLHRWITGAGPRLEVHHRNGDGRDNRRANLQLLARPDHRLVDPGVRPRTGFHGVGARRRGFQLRLPRRAGLPPRHFRRPYVAAVLYDEYLRAAVPGLEVAWNFPRRLSPGRFAARMRRRAGEPFRAVFVCRTEPRVREMDCRTPLPLEQAARPPRIDAPAARLLLVIDLALDEYRYIPLEGLLCARVGKEWYRCDG